MIPLALDFDAVAKLLAPVFVAIVGALLKRYLEGKPNVITYLVHSVSHPLPPTSSPEQDGPRDGLIVNTHTIVVRNTGKRSAHNVRIDHAYFPVSYNLFPPVSHTVTTGPNGSAEICIPLLAPKEQVTVSYLYFPPVTWAQISGWVKSDEGLAKVIQVFPSIPPSKPLMALFWALIFIGASVVVYWGLKALPLVVA